MNYLNNQSINSYQTSTISSLQAYIAELTQYINDNNAKYTRNLSTLKNFYEDQITVMNNTIVELDEQVLRLKNQNITYKDILLNREKQFNELKLKIGELKQVNDNLEQRCRNEREKNLEGYQQIQEIRKNMQEMIDGEVERGRKAEGEKVEVELKLKQKQCQIKILKSEQVSLEQKVAQRYTLPQRYKQLQLQLVRDRTTISTLHQRINQLSKQKDYLLIEVQRRQKQNQKLIIEVNRYKGDVSYEIATVVSKEKQRLGGEIENLRMENERKVYEIKDLEIKFMEITQQNDKLEGYLNQGKSVLGSLQQQIKQLKDDKNIYLNEFRKLKEQYQQIINTLQGTIPEYQKKNWRLEQQNQDLNTQLDGLQELLREIRAMNDMEPMRKQYRQWAELNLVAERKLAEQQGEGRKEMRDIEREEGKSYLVRSNETDINPDWKRLLQQIQKIQI